MNLTPDQLHQIGQLSDQWSFLWDKRRSLWIAAEDCPDGEQVEEPDLDVLLTRLPVMSAPRGNRKFQLHGRSFQVGGHHHSGLADN